jgi:VWFA-related protein
VHRFHRAALTGFGFLLILAAALGLHPVASTDKPTGIGKGNLELGQRKELPGEAASVEGLIRLDATVTDQAGKAVAGLQLTDFRLLDNGQPQKIIAFRALKGAVSSAEDSLTVIILLDTLGLTSYLADLERQQVVQFLRHKSAKLAHPVTIYSLQDSGFFLTAKSSTDREALATSVASDSKVEAYFLSPKVPSPFKAVVEPSFEAIPALTGLRALWNIAAAEASLPGRKLLLWLGPGLGDRGTGAIAPDGRGLVGPSRPGTIFDATSGKKGEEIKRDLFQKIHWFSILLRQARVTLDCLSIGGNEPTAETWNRFLTAVPSERQASWMNLFKNVLAVQSGGRVLFSSSGLVGPMEDSIENAGIFYSLTFDPPLAAHADEYHSLQVEVNQPSLTVDTSKGYYNQPFYNDPPDTRIRQVTVSQLEQILQATHGGGSVARQLSDIALTERLSQIKLQSLLAQVHDNKLREALELIANESTFLDSPSAELSADPPPDQAEQQRILKAAADYLGHVIPILPDFFATRSAIYYREVASYPGLATVDVSQPLHAEQQMKETVFYRQGVEIASSASPQTRSEVLPLSTSGTFGPILSLLQAVLKSPGDVTWESWKQSTNGRRAVFRYRLTGVPTLTLSGCCYPNGNGGAQVRFAADSHGEFVIDPGTGAIIRIQTEAELPGFVPEKRSDMMVSYGPVEIGGGKYIVPLRSVNIARSRSVPALLQWNVEFNTWGPFETQMNVFTFDQYHLFHGKARLLPGFEQAPDKR